MPDSAAEDGVTKDVYTWPYGEVVADSLESGCLTEYAGWVPFCECEYDPEKPLQQDDLYCRCKHLVCIENQHSGDAGMEAACNDVLTTAGEDPGTCI